MVDVFLDAGNVEPPSPLLPAEGWTHRLPVIIKLVRRNWGALNKDFYAHFFTSSIVLTCTMVNRDNSNIKQSILGTWCRQWWEGRGSNKGTVMFDAFLGHFNFLYPLFNVYVDFQVVTLFFSHWLCLSSLSPASGFQVSMINIIYKISNVYGVLADAGSISSVPG